MDELISIIIPVYNVEKFLDKCINSIVNQTYKNLEIIIIDDGSTDNSGKMCEAWKIKDNRIKVLHQQNFGAGHARNVGIEASTGKWIFFVDSDDYLKLEIIELLYKNAIKTSSDVSSSGYIVKMFQDEIIKYNKENYVVNSEEALRKMLVGEGISTFVCDKLYKKELFETIKFPEGKNRERIAVLYKLFDKASKISHISEAGYYYVQRNGSLSHAEFTSERLTNGIEFLEEMLNFICEKYSKLQNEAEAYFTTQLHIAIINCYKNNAKEVYKDLKSKLKSYMKRILKNPKIKFRKKVKSIFLAYFEGSKFLKEN